LILTLNRCKFVVPNERNEHKHLSYTYLKGKSYDSHSINLLEEKPVIFWI